MPDEKAKIDFTGDTSHVAAALRGLKGVAESALSGVRETFKSTFEKVVFPLTPSGLAEPLKAVMDSIKQIERVGESTGLGAEMWQKFAFTLRQVGVEAEQGEKSLSHLAETIGDAASGQQRAEDVFTKWGISIKNANGGVRETSSIIDDIAVRMDTLSGATERTAMAQEMFGIGAGKMVAALKEWRAAHGAGASIISKEDIASLNEANDKLDEMVSTITVGLASMLGPAYDKIAKAARGFGMLSTGIDARELGGDAAIVANLRANAGKDDTFNAVDPEKTREIKELRDAANKKHEEGNAAAMVGQKRITELTKQEAEIKAKIDALNNEGILTQDETIAGLKLQNELEEKRTQIQREQTELNQKNIDMQAEAHRADVEITKLKERESDRARDKYLPTLQDLAQKSHFISRDPLTGEQFYSGSDQGARDAAYISDSEKNLTTYAGAHGWDASAQSLSSQIDSMKQALASMGRIGNDADLRSMAEAMGLAKDHLATIEHAATQSGIILKNIVNTQ